MVVVFDDFIGSGNKAIRRANWLKRLANDKGVTEINFFYLSLAAMEFGLRNIYEQVGGPVFSSFPLKKGITERYSSAEADFYIKLMLNIESRLGKRYKRKKLDDYSMGYSSSETLYCAENDNCPNNVFPVFWWRVLRDGLTFRTILNRAG